MNRFLNKIEKIFSFLENSPMTFASWVISFIALMGLSAFLQNFLYGFHNHSAQSILGQIIQPFYLILYFAMVIFLKFITKEDIKKIMALVLWSLWLTVPRPFIDKIILGDTFYVSFYVFEGTKDLLLRGITFFGQINPVGILYGTRIELLFILLITFLYVLIKRKKSIMALLATLGIYVIFYVLCSLPSFITLIYSGFSGAGWMTSAADVARIFISPLNYFGVAERGFHVALFYKITLIYNLIFLGLLIWLQIIIDKNKLKVLFKNTRYPQLFFTWAILLGGMIVAGIYFPENKSWNFFSFLVVINLMLAMGFAWFFSVVENDLSDVEIDKISNQNRPLVRGIFGPGEYRRYGYIFLALALLFSLAVSAKTFFIIVIYLLLVWVYSNYPFRLKRIVIISSLASAAALFFVFLAGYTLMANDQSIGFFPWKAVIFLFIAAALIIPLKDIKDIEGDKQDGIQTLPTLLGEKDARLLFSSIVFIVYFISLLVFEVREFFLIALLFGGFNYWVINRRKTKAEYLLLWTLGIAMVYGILLLAKHI